MALNDFDIAFTNKVKAWFSNTVFANTALVYNVAYNLIDDPSTELRFPLISIYRPSGFKKADMQNFAARKRGIEFYYDDLTNKSINARFITVTLPYQIDIYAKNQESLNSITENIMQALNFDQAITVTQKDLQNDVDYVESYDITHSEGPAELSEFQNDDRIYHYSLVYTILNARLLNFKVMPGVEQVDVDIKDTDDSFSVLSEDNIPSG